MAFGNESIEWNDEIEGLVEELEEQSAERELTREERALIDVVDTVRLIEEGDGLHDFWQSGLDHQRVINSFDMVGASALVDVFNASQWCQSRTEDRGEYSDVESNHLSEIEEDLFEALKELNDQVEEFIEDELEI